MVRRRDALEENVVVVDSKSMQTAGGVRLVWAYGLSNRYLHWQSTTMIILEP
jgi:hypothetical protein